MKIRPLLTAGFAAALAAAAFAAPGLAAASPTPSPAQSASTVLSKADFVGPSGLVSIGKPAGIIPARNAPSARALGAAAAPSAEPNSNLTYHGGPVQQSPRVYLLFWGHKWTTNALHKTVKNRLINFYKGLGRTPRDAWSLTESQYSGKGGRPAFGRSFFVKSAVDTSALPSGGITFQDLGHEAAKGAGIFGLPVSPAAHNFQIVIAVQSGACFQPANGLNFAGNCGVPPGPTTVGYCAFHSFDFVTGNSNLILPWVNLPFQLDARGGCGENFINKGAAGQLDGFTIVSGHETAETVTDPAESAWFDQNDGISGGEIADKCAWGGAAWQQSPPDPAGDIGLVTGSFPMQSLWSNAKHRCVMTGKLPFRVSHLANQTSTVGKAVSIQVPAATAPKVPLTFKASGLPKGLSINRGTGRISGTPAKAGTFTVTITVSYYAGTSSFRFTWFVRK